MGRELILDEKLLKRQYLTDKLSIVKIAKFHNCSETAIKRRLSILKIKQNHKEKNPIKIGDKFGKLTVIESAGLYKTKTHSHRLWKCICDCNNLNTKNCITTHLKNGRIKSCGCLQRLTAEQKHNWKGCGELYGTHFGSILKRATKKNIEFNLTVEFLWNLFLKQDRKCALSGIELSLQGKEVKKYKETASLDRIDSSKGYTEDNVQWVHKIVNLMKQSLSDKEFVKWCKLIAKGPKS